MLSTRALVRNETLIASFRIWIRVDDYIYIYIYTTVVQNKMDKEIDNSQAKASSAFGRLYKRTWYNRRMKKDARSMCLEPSSLSPSYRAQIRGVLIGPNYYPSNCSTTAVFAPPLISTGVIPSPKLKSLKKRKSPISRPCDRSPCYAGLDTSLGCSIIACPGSFDAVSSPLVITIEGHQRSDSRTARKKILWCLLYRPSPMVHPSREP